MTPFYYRSYVSNKEKRGFCDAVENNNPDLKICFFLSVFHPTHVLPSVWKKAGQTAEN